MRGTSMMTDPGPVASLDDDQWCSINEAARRLGVTATAIRNRIKRGTLETRPNGNLGKLVRVPLPLPEPVTSTVSEPVHLTVIETLNRHIERLEAQLVDALRHAADRDEVAARRDVIAGQVAALQAVLHAEKQRIIELQVDRDGLRADRDRWVAQAERLAAQADRLTAANRPRKWWPWRRVA
jgi:hypothetical protein